MRLNGHLRHTTFYTPSHSFHSGHPHVHGSNEVFECVVAQLLVCKVGICGQDCERSSIFHWASLLMTRCFFNLLIDCGEYLVIWSHGRILLNRLLIRYSHVCKVEIRDRDSEEGSLTLDWASLLMTRRFNCPQIVECICVYPPTLKPSATQISSHRHVLVCMVISNQDSDGSKF